MPAHPSRKNKDAARVGHPAVLVPKKGISAALRDAKNTMGMLSPGCAALHPGLFSHLPSGKTEDDEPGLLRMTSGKTEVDEPGWLRMTSG